MKCPYCNQETSNTLSFCSKCGRSFDSGTQKEKSTNKSMVVIVVLLVVIVIVLMSILSIGHLDNRNRNNTRSTDGVNQKETSSVSNNEKPHENIEETNKNESDNRSDEVYSVVEQPKYITKTFQKYNLTLAYPDHYIETTADSNENEIISLKDPNGAALLQYFGLDSQNISIVDAAQVLSQSIKDNGGKLIDEKADDTSLFQKYRKGNIVYIIKGINTGNNLCFMNFSYAEFENHVYQKYYDYLDQHFNAIAK